MLQSAGIRPEGLGRQLSSSVRKHVGDRQTGEHLARRESKYGAQEMRERMRHDAFLNNISVPIQLAQQLKRTKIIKTYKTFAATSLSRMSITPVIQGPTGPFGNLDGLTSPGMPIALHSGSVL